MLPFVLAILGGHCMTEEIEKMNDQTVSRTMMCMPRMDYYV
jgi:hypothetical protein